MTRTLGSIATCAAAEALVMAAVAPIHSQEEAAVGFRERFTARAVVTLTNENLGTGPVRLVSVRAEN